MAQLPIPQNLLEAVNGMPLPQTQDSVQGDMAPAQGRNGTSLIMHGRVWQVGSGATTTSIPILDSNGLPVLMSASMQALYTQAKFEIVQAGTVELAVVTAVASNGTLTLDSPLSSSPSAGAAFLLTPTEQTSLSGRNVTELTLFNALAITDTTVHFGTTISNSFKKIAFFAQNSLNQTLTLGVQFKGTLIGSGQTQSWNGTAFANLPTLTLPVASQKLYFTLKDFGIDEMQGLSSQILLYASATTAPTSGSLSVVGWGVPN